MKKVLVVLLCVLFASTAFAFEKGTKSIGGWIGFESYKANKDADPITALEFMPWGGYFVVDNVCVDLLLDYYSVNSKDWDDPVTEFGFGIGGRYFFDKIYGGAGFMMESYNDGTLKYSGNYLLFDVGYVYPLVANVYVDAGFCYAMGMGKYGGDLDEVDNEESGFDFGIGLEIFFK